MGSDIHHSVNDLAVLVAGSMGKPETPVVHLDARNEVQVSSASAAGKRCRHAVDNRRCWQHAYASHAKLHCAFMPPAPVLLRDGLVTTAAFVKAHGSFEPTGYTSLELTERLPPSWASFLTTTPPSAAVALAASATDIQETEVVMFVPTPVGWEVVDPTSKSMLWPP